MPDNYADLQKELQQCGALLELLTEKFSRIAAAIAGRGANSDGEAEEDLFPSQNQEGNKEASLFLSQNTEEHSAQNLLPSKFSEGNNMALVFPSENLDGNNKHSVFPSENPEGNKSESSPLSQNVEGNKPGNQAATVAALPALPDTGQVYNALRGGEMKGVKRQTILNTAMILMRFRDQPGRWSQAQLGAWLKLSKTGMAKFMMMLFRRGLIVRTAYQTYGLTAKAAAILEEARHAASGIPVLKHKRR